MSASPLLPFTDLRTRPQSADGNTIVLLHVFGGARRFWLEAGLMLSQSCRVLSIDTPGFGEAHDIPGYTIEQMGDAFAETIGALHLERFTLVGHSMTGKVAATLAARRLPGLKKLVLLTPSPLSPEPIPDKARATMLAQATGTREDAETYLKENSALPIPEEVFTRCMEDRMRATPNAWRAWLEHGSREDWSARIEPIAQPALVIAAGQDKTLGPEVQQRLTMPHLRDARMEVIADSGHMVPLEAPSRLANLLRQFSA